MSMQGKAKNIDEFWEMAGDRAGELKFLDELIRAEASALPPVKDRIFYGMLSYGMQPYRTKSGTGASEWPSIMLAAQKNYMSLYICAIDEDGKYIAEKNADKLGKVNCGKSCVRFKKVEDLNLHTLRNILRELNAKTVRGEKFFGL